MQLGKSLIIFGILCMISGVIFMFRDKIPFASLIGQLPGDIVVKRDGYQIHFPIVSCLLLSIIVSLVFRIFR